MGIAKRNKDFERGYYRGLKDGVDKAYKIFEQNRKTIKRPKEFCNRCKLYDIEKQTCVIFGRINQESSLDKYGRASYYPNGIRPKRCKNKIVFIK